MKSDKELICMGLEKLKADLIRHAREEMAKPDGKLVERISVLISTLQKLKEVSDRLDIEFESTFLDECPF